MKRIILCVVLAIICLIVGAFSFLVSDLPSYHRWMNDNGPRIMENFKFSDRDKEKRDFQKGPSNEEDHMIHRDNRPDTMRNGGPLDGNHRGPMMGPQDGQQTPSTPSDKEK